MPEIPRLNPAIRALDSGKPAFVTFSPAEVGAAQSIGAAAYDAVVFEMEHNPYDIRQLRDCMQYNPRQYDHPEVAAAIDDILAICQDAGMPCGHPHVDANNVEKLVEKGFRWLMPAPSQSFAALEKGLKAAGRK